MNLRMISILFFSLIVLSACSGGSNYSLQPPDNQPLELTKLSADGMPDQQPANQAKQILSENEEVEAVHAINDGQELVIGIKLKHHDRFRMDGIESKLRKKMKRNYSDMTVTLSTDKKIHLELENFEQDLQSKKVPKDTFNKRLQKIKKLSKEET